MGQSNISARHRELGAELRKRRLAAEVTVSQVSEDTGWHRTKIARVESGRYPTDPVEAILYLGACGVHRAEALDLLKLCREAVHNPGYWLSPQGEWLKGSLSSLIYHEATADRSIGYEPLVVPGLLQTPAYSCVMIERSAARSSRSTEEAVRIRETRKEIVHRRNPAEFVFFVHEQALRIEVGNAAIMHEQLLHMVLMAALRHVTLRIVPAAAREYSVFSGPFRLFTYRKHASLVYLDNHVTGVFIEDRDVVGDYLHLLPELNAVALDEGQSRKFAADLADEYDRGSSRRHGPIYELEEEQL
jgi:transcriptional regulator with XRE-family HTH domain